MHILPVVFVLVMYVPVAPAAAVRATLAEQ